MYFYTCLINTDSFSYGWTPGFSPESSAGSCSSWKVLSAPTRLCSRRDQHRQATYSTKALLHLQRNLPSCSSAVFLSKALPKVANGKPSDPAGPRTSKAHPPLPLMTWGSRSSALHWPRLQDGEGSWSPGCPWGPRLPWWSCWRQHPGKRAAPTSRCLEPPRA